MYAICVKISIMNLCFLKSYTNKKTIDRPRYIQSGGSCSSAAIYLFVISSTVKGCFLIDAKALHVIYLGSLPSIMGKRTCSLFNDDQLSSIINMLASSWIKRFFHSRKSEEVRLCWTRNHMSLPLIPEKVKRSAITENKQKDLTKSSSTLLVAEEAFSLLFFIFLSPLSP